MDVVVRFTHLYVHCCAPGDANTYLSVQNSTLRFIGCMKPHTKGLERASEHAHFTARMSYVLAPDRAPR